MWFFLKNKLNRIWRLLFGVSNLVRFGRCGQALTSTKNDFVAQRRMLEPFQETEMDKRLPRTPLFLGYTTLPRIGGEVVRIFSPVPFGATTAAKPSGIQDLFDFHISKNNVRVF